MSAIASRSNQMQSAVLPAIESEVPEPHVARARRGKLLRFRADRAAVTVVGVGFAAHLGVYWLATPLGAALATIPLFLLSLSIAPLNHHHQHVNVFRSALLNRAYDLMLALQTGAGPYTWVLHHNLGHHLNYLNQPPHEVPDESHWTRRDGSPMGRVEYTFHLLLDHQRDVHRMGRKHPGIYRSFWLMRIPLYAIIIAFLVASPYNFLFAFAIPAILTLLHTCWATYEHHAGQPTSNHYEASVNRIHSLYNVLSWNLGYHAAHHLRAGVHWSELPKLHREIESKIPQDQILTTFW